MTTQYYNGMYINIGRLGCYVTDDTGYFVGRRFKSYRAAQLAITKARRAGVPASR